MSYFKKFTDFLSGLGIFFAILHFLEKYMEYDFGKEAPTSITEKFKVFLDAKDDVRHFLFLLILMALTLLVSRILPKLQILVLFVSVLPFYVAVNMLVEDKFFAKPMLYLVITALAFFGAVYDLINTDRESSRRHALLAVNILGAVYSLSLLVIGSISKMLDISSTYSSLGEKELAKIDNFELIGIDIMKQPDEAQLRFMQIMAIVTILSVFLSFIFDGAYFIDLIFSLGMLIFMFIKWHAEALRYASAAVCLPIILYFVLRLCIFFFEPQKAQKTE